MTLKCILELEVRLKLFICIIFGLPLTNKDIILHKIRSGLSLITYHTFHVTYCMLIFKFYKIITVIPEVLIKVSLKILNYRNYCISNIDMLVKSKIGQTTHIIVKISTLWKIIFFGKFPIYLNSIFLSQKVIKKLWVIKNPRLHADRFLYYGRLVFFTFFLTCEIFNRT